MTRYEPGELGTLGDLTLEVFPGCFERGPDLASCEGHIVLPCL